MTLSEYAVLFALVAIMGAGLPGPGDAALIAAGCLAGEGKLNVGLVLTTAMVAWMLGSVVGYVIGVRGGRPLLDHPGRFEKRRRKLLAKGDRAFGRHTFVASATLPAFVSGIFRVRFWLFMLGALVAGIGWIGMYVGLAYFFGEEVAKRIGSAGAKALLWAILLVVVGLAVRAGWARWRAARQRQAARTGLPAGRPGAITPAGVMCRGGRGATMRGVNESLASVYRGTRARRWLARLSFALVAAAVVILAVFAGLKSIPMLVVGLAGAAVSLAAAFFFLSRRGVLRWVSLAVFVAAPVAVIVVYAFRDLLWVAVVLAAAWLLASMTARLALAGDQADWRMPERPAQPPARHPYLIMNPKSGGGKVGKFDLARKAEDLGAEVFLLGGPEHVDVAEVARKAVAKGADLLGVAGGDGTQALVAGVAAEHGLPFVVISAGTRNHFALDLGLDREDPAACLGALSDGVELRVDLGMINDQVFVNNASFGAYAEIVETPAYRGDKLNTTLNLLPDLLQGHRGARLCARADGTRIQAPQAVLVSNNPYGTGDIAGLGRRARLDRGLLGVVALQVATARQAAGLLRGRHATGVSVLTTERIEITADAAQIPVGIDGEAVPVPTPVLCTVSPGALRVWVPRHRPGITPPKPPVNWARLWHLAMPWKPRGPGTPEPGPR